MRCLTPLVKHHPKNTEMEQNSIPIPCGKCPACVKNKISQWSFRLRKEGDASTSSYFLTLTYDTEHVPISRNGYMTLNPDHVTLWLKRLRKVSKQKIKYYYVGEYGSKTNRPHYHMLIFNAELEDIENTWNYGAVHYGSVTGASIGYTLKYMIKDGRIPMHRNDDRLPEYGRMSNGIGASYLTADILYWHTNRARLLHRLCCEIDGKKVPMPRYYKEKIYDKVHKYLIQQEAKKINAKSLEKRDITVNIALEIEAHKAEWEKMLKSKYKNKHV